MPTLCRLFIFNGYLQGYSLNLLGFIYKRKLIKNQKRKVITNSDNINYIDEEII